MLRLLYSHKRQLGLTIVSLAVLAATTVLMLRNAPEASDLIPAGIRLFYGCSSGELKGKVLTTAGQPVADATVSIQGETTRSAPDGSYQFTDLPASEYLLYASIGSSKSKVFTVPIRNDVVVKDLILYQVYSVEGRVKYSDGTAVTSGSVQATNTTDAEGEGGGISTISSSGTFKIEGLFDATSYSVAARDSEKRYSPPQSVTIQGKNTNIDDLTLVIDKDKAVKPRIYGYVIRQDTGEKMRSFNVYLWSDGYSPSRSPDLSTLSNSTNNPGYYEIDSPGAGQHALLAYGPRGIANQYYISSLTTLDYDGQAELRSDLLVDKAGYVKAVVRYADGRQIPEDLSGAFSLEDQQGNPIVSATISPTFSTGNFAESNYAINGPIPRGSYRLRFDQSLKNVHLVNDVTFGDSEILTAFLINDSPTSFNFRRSQSFVRHLIPPLQAAPPKLQTCGLVKGTVKNSLSSLPVNGATVQVVSRSTNKAFESTTDSTGQFATRNLEINSTIDNDFTVTLKKAEGYIVPSPEEQAKDPDFIKPNNPIRLNRSNGFSVTANIQVKPVLGEIKGYVTKETGEVITNQEVLLHLENEGGDQLLGTTKANPNRQGDGSFSFSQVPIDTTKDPNRFIVKATQVDGQLIGKSYGTETRPSPIEVTKKDNYKKSSVSVLLTKRHASLEGKVGVKDNSYTYPVAGVKVYRLGGSNPTLLATTGEDGSYKAEGLAVPPGAITLVAEYAKETRRFQPDKQSITLRPGLNRLNFTIQTLESNKLYGKVTLKGKPMAGVEVTIYKIDSGTASLFQRTISNQQGSYSTNMLVPGQYQAKIESGESKILGLSDPVTFTEPGQQARRDIALLPKAAVGLDDTFSLKLSVSGSDAFLGFPEPLKQWQAKLLGPDNFEKSFTDQNPKVTDLKRGYYTVEVERNGYFPAKESVLLGDTSNQSITVVLYGKNVRNDCRSYKQGTIIDLWFCGPKPIAMAESGRYNSHWQSIEQAVTQLRRKYGIKNLPQQVIVRDEGSALNAYYDSGECRDTPSIVRPSAALEYVAFTAALVEASTPASIYETMVHEWGHGADFRRGQCKGYISAESPFAYWWRDAFLELKLIKDSEYHDDEPSVFSSGHPHANKMEGYASSFHAGERHYSQFLDRLRARSDLKATEKNSLKNMVDFSLMIQGVLQ